MRKIKEVLRLRSLGLNQHQIARSCSIAQSTVHEYVKAAEAAGIAWPLPAEWDDGQLEQVLLPARPWAGLADCYAQYPTYSVAPPNEAYPKAKAAAAKALEIDEGLAEPHASLRFAKTHYEWDWAGAEKEFKRSMELAPNYASAHSWYGNLLTAQGRLDEAIAQQRRAQQMEPLSLIISSGLGRNLFFARRYDQAIEQLRKVLDMEPNFARAHWYLGMAYEQKGMYAEAMAEFQKGISFSGGEPGMILAPRAGRGNETPAERRTSRPHHEPGQPGAERPDGVAVGVVGRRGT